MPTLVDRSDERLIERQESLQSQIAALEKDRLDAEALPESMDEFLKSLKPLYGEHEMAFAAKLKKHLFEERTSDAVFSCPSFMAMYEPISWLNIEKACREIPDLSETLKADKAARLLGADERISLLKKSLKNLKW